MRCAGVLVVFLFIELCNGYGYGYGYGGEGYGGRGGDYKDEKCGELESCDYYSSCDDGKCIKDYDNEKYFYEPCDYPDDEDCVRKFFGKYGQCKVVYREDRKPVYREEYLSYLPKIDLTLVTTRVRLTNLDGKIERFYINKKTGNLVFAVDFKGIEINSRSAIFIVDRRGREPAVAKDRANATYPVTLTAVIPIKEGITLKALKDSSVSAFLPDPLIKFYIGPKVLESKDPDIAKALVGLFADIPTAFKEILLTEAPNFFLAYLQKYICDFGIPLSSDSDVRSVYNVGGPLKH